MQEICSMNFRKIKIRIQKYTTAGTKCRTSFQAATIPSPIQTILSVPDLHQVHRLVLINRTGHGLRSICFITAGWEFHPTPKEINQY